MQGQGVLYDIPEPIRKSLSSEMVAEYGLHTAKYAPPPTPTSPPTPVHAPTPTRLRLPCAVTWYRPAIHAS
jgi:hypothetical protein